MYKLYRSLAVRQAYAYGGFICLVLALVASQTMGSYSFQLSTGYLSSNALLSQSSTVFAPAYQVLWTIQFRWLLVVVLLLAGLASLACSYFINNRKKSELDKCKAIDGSLTSGLLILIVTLLAGVQDLMTIMLMVGVTIAAFLLFRVAIANSETNKSPTKIVYKLGLIIAALPWLVTVTYYINTWSYGGIRQQWFAYVLLILGLMNLSIVAYGYFQSSPKTSSRKYLLSEKSLLVAGQLIKAVFALILIIGLKR